MEGIRLFFAGDFCSKPSTSFINVSSELKDIIQSCDAGIVNFEVPLKPDVFLQPQKRERFYQNDDAPDFLKNIGFTLFPMSNNHAFDWDDAGYEKTKQVLGDAMFGCGSYEEAYRVKVVSLQDKKVGFLALTFAAYKGVFSDVEKHEGLGCAYINDLKVNHIIMDAKQKVDYLFVLAHDGIEYIDAPLPETIARYRDFIDYGADGVIGSHPHCPQGWEEYKGRPIFYSLGNFFFNSKADPSNRSQRPHWYEGRCIVMNLTEQGITWQVVNTKNVDNIGLEIDYDDNSVHHNDKLISYLKDKSAYEEYLLPKLKLEYQRRMRTIDTTVHRGNLKDVVRAVLNCAIHGNKKNKIQSDSSLRRIFQHDLHRYTMLRMMDE